MQQPVSSARFHVQRQGRERTISATGLVGSELENISKDLRASKLKTVKTLVDPIAQGPHIGAHAFGNGTYGAPRWVPTSPEGFRVLPSKVGRQSSYAMSPCIVQLLA